MDYKFPHQLFPSFYNSGPPDLVQKHCAGKWGVYGQVRPQGGSGSHPSWTVTSRHQVRGTTWGHTEPVPIPLLSPKNTVLWPLKPPDPLDFTKHMQNFFMDHSRDAFGCMGEMLGDNFYFKPGMKEKFQRHSVHMWKLKNFLKLLEFNICHQTYNSDTMDEYSTLMSDVVHTIPPQLLGSLLYEELSEQRDRILFCEGATGGALAFVPFSQSSGGSQHGCLIYPGNKGLDRLNFHRVELQHHRGSSSFVDASSSDPFSFQLKGPIRQISSASLFNTCCVAVRSDHFCGVWRFGEKQQPCLLQVINTREVATCVNASPHVLGEVLVASESGAAHLWTVGRGMQKVREEKDNLYFNAMSSWRWCEFSAHPRVLLYADRTGVDLTDMRVSPVLSHTLFHISNTSQCYNGERLILSKYLGDVHPFHHLITTQHSAYIMDERFPGIPMLKFDHMMQSPPMFCHVGPGSTSSGSSLDGAVTTNILLGSHRSQEITLLQYSGGRAEACLSQGPPQAMLRPRDSLKHLPVQIPHRLESATNRLSSPAAGLTCIVNKGGREAGGQDCICILQLTEAGDIFYQILEPVQLDSSRPPTAEDDALPEQVTRAEQLQPDSRLVVSDTSSDEGVIKPTQGLTVQRLVAETPERELNCSSQSSSEGSESGGKSRKLKRLRLLVNRDQELDQLSGLERDAIDGGVGKNNADTEDPGTMKEPVSSSNSLGPCKSQTPVKLSNSVLVLWKHWLQKLMQKSYENKFHSPCQHFTIKNEGLLQLSGDNGDLREEEHVQKLRYDLRAHMSKRSLLVHSTVSAPYCAPDVVPVPNPVDTDVWTDQLSHRLTLSWQGESAWQKWWEEELGLNKEKKVEALKRKRRREKEAKRASGRRMDLSGSFASSVSYQSDLDDFSASGWSSGTSQGAWSDAESTGSHWRPRSVTPTALQTDAEIPSPWTTPQSVKDKQDDQQTPTSSCPVPLSQTAKPDSTPVSQRRNKHSAKDYLSSLFATQDDERTMDTPAPPVTSSSFHLKNLRVLVSRDSSMLSGLSQSVPKKTGDLSQNTPVLPGFSQSQSFSQSLPLSQSLSQSKPLSQSQSLSQSKPLSQSQSLSQSKPLSQSQSFSQSSQRRLLQSSQPKKKSRMGF